MDQFPPDIARDRPLDQLVAGGLVQLEKLGYSRRSLRRYHAIWRHLTAFAQQEGLGATFSEDLAVRFVEAYRLRADETIEPSEGWRRHVVYGIRVLAAFARDGHVERCRTDMQKVQIPPAMKKPLRDYEVYGQDRLYLRPSSLSLRIRELAIFLALCCRRFGYPGMPVRPVNRRIESDGGDPLMHDPSILARRDMRRSRQATGEQITLRLQIRRCDPCGDSGSGRLGQLKLHRPLRLPLHHHRAGQDLIGMHHVSDAQVHQIAAPQLAVDCQVEHGQVA